MSSPKGPYTLWQDYGYEGWGFEDFETLAEALSADRGVNWHISRPVSYCMIDTSPLTPEEAADITPCNGSSSTSSQS